MNNRNTSVVKTKEEMKETVSFLRKAGKSVGFVPTMGYLHAGHLNLVKRAKEMTDVVVVSIYVNLAQFTKGEDFSRYPRDTEKDLIFLEELGTDLVFLPPPDRMYDNDHLTWVSVEKLEDKLCGRSRKGHFRGVATIVLKLLHIVNPDLMFMGEKDYQQVLLLEKMLHDLDMSVKIIRCPTLREEDGLAMSSRNCYLSPTGRRNAAVLYRSLIMAQKMYDNGIYDAATVITGLKKLIEEKEGRIDYIEVVDSKTLEPLPVLQKGCRIALAVFIEGTRLIDNMEIS